MRSLEKSLPSSRSTWDGPAIQGKSLDATSLSQLNPTLPKELGLAPLLHLLSSRPLAVCLFLLVLLAAPSQASVCSGADLEANVPDQMNDLTVSTMAGDVVIAPVIVTSLHASTSRGTMSINAEVTQGSLSCSLAANSNTKRPDNFRFDVDWLSPTNLQVQVHGFSGSFRVHADDFAYTGDPVIGTSPPYTPRSWWGQMDDWGKQDIITVDCPATVRVMMNFTYNQPLCSDPGCFYIDLRAGDGRCNWPNGTVRRLDLDSCVAAGGYPGYMVPSYDTTYTCWFWTLPSSVVNTHIVRIDPIIDQEEHYHHNVINLGTAGFIAGNQIPQTGHGPCAVDSDCGANAYLQCVAGTCVQNARTVGTLADGSFLDCTMGGEFFVYVWAVGQPSFSWPIEAGLRGGPPGYTAFGSGLHYDNPKLLSGIIDRSGLRLWITPNKRANDAGWIGLGGPAGAVSGAYPNGLPPPGQPGYVAFPPGVAAYARCDMSQLRPTLPALPQTMTVFAYWCHMHQVGSRIWATQYKNIGGRWWQSYQFSNPTTPFDFSRQEVFSLNPHVQISLADYFTTHCQWDTAGKTTYTQFGERSQDEMCGLQLLVYPLPYASIGCFDGSGAGFINLNGSVVA